MSKRLLVMRHAKSSWSEEGLSDFQRPLNKRGRRVTPKIAEYLHSIGIRPDLIVSSSAVRARTTAEIFAEQCGINENQLMFLDELYHATAATCIDVIARFCDESIETLMLVAHNPGLEYLVEKISGSWEAMPTAAVASFELDGIAWSEFATMESITMNQVWRPKEIGIE